MSAMTNLPIFDGHNDTLLDMYVPSPGEERSFFVQSEHGHLDLPRARAGGLGGGFFAIFVVAPKKNEAKESVINSADKKEPAPALEHRYALEFTMGMAGTLFRLEAESKGQFKVVRTVDELTSCLRDGIMAAILHFEGAETIDTDLNALYVFYEAGLRSLGITWSRPNAFAHGVPFDFPSSPDTGPGLTEAGKELVRACNQLGIMLDLSHLNEKGFWDVAKLSNAPLVATHSNAHVLSPSSRNLTDKQLDAIKESDGIVGINFHRGFLRADGDSKQETSLTEIVRHLDYIANRIGIDRVALGSDFDGAKMPQDLHDVAGLPKLVAALRQHGYDEDALKKIAYQNWVRVLRKTWRA
ncbi:MAG: dipeptidase [Ardenticatenaceae bacterium]